MAGRQDTTPKPWACSSPSARFCCHHGDCCCMRSMADDRITERSTQCPLHGLRTEHPFRGFVFVPPRGRR